MLRVVKLHKAYWCRPIDVGIEVSLLFLRSSHWSEGRRSKKFSCNTCTLFSSKYRYL